MSQIIEQAKYTCALGAQQTVLAITKGIPIIHAGPGCSSRQFAFLSKGAGYQGEGYAGGGHVPSTNSSQSEVVFGGERKLRATVEGTLRVMKGDLYVILSGCTAGIVGDDVEQVAREFRDQGYPVVGVDTAGFLGTNYKGHQLVVNGIIEQLVGEKKPEVRKGVVNVFSVVPYQNPYWRGDLEEIKRLLTAIGLEPHILYGNESNGVEEWKDIPNAAFNLVLSAWNGLPAAQLCEKLYGTPYLHYEILPTGLKETSRFLRKVGEYAKLDKERVEAVIKKEEIRYKKYFIQLGDLFSDYGCYLPYQLYMINDSIYGPGISKYMVEELGFQLKGFYETDEPDGTAKSQVIKILRSIDEEAEKYYKVDGNNHTIQEDIREKIKKNRAKSVIVGSSWDKQLAQTTDSILVHGSMPIVDQVILNKTYAGYNGGLRLLEDIYSGLFNEGMITNTTHSEKKVAGLNCGH